MTLSHKVKKNRALGQLAAMCASVVLLPMGTVMPTRMAVLLGSVEMGCDQFVSLNLNGPV